MRVVVDTNILFSALLNSKSNIGNLLFLSGKRFSFYSCTHLRNEIQNNWDKLKTISGLSDKNLNDSLFVLYKRITFINEELIPDDIWHKATKLVQHIDPDDIPFIALTEFLNAVLWTGDKVLYKGLKARNYKRIIITSEMLSVS